MYANSDKFNVYKGNFGNILTSFDFTAGGNDFFLNNCTSKVSTIASSGTLCHTAMKQVSIRKGRQLLHNISRIMINTICTLLYLYIEIIL